MYVQRHSSELLTMMTSQTFRSIATALALGAVLAGLGACGGAAVDGPTTPGTKVPPTPVASSVSISLASSTLAAGGTTTATAVVRDQTGAVMADGVVAWSSVRQRVGATGVGDGRTATVEGRYIGRDTLVATVGAYTAKVPVEVTSTETSALRIEIRAYPGGGADAKLMAAAQAAVARWQRVILSNAPTTTVTPPTGGICPLGTETVSGLVVWVRYAEMKESALATTCANHSDGRPAMGVILFNVARPWADPYSLNLTMVHELGHVIGFGAYGKWTTLVNTATSPVTYVGPRARAVFEELGLGSGPVPMQSAVHWLDGGAYEGDAMTAGAGGCLYPFTVAAMEDLGYRVRYSGADPYGNGASKTCAW